MPNLSFAPLVVALCHARKEASDALAFRRRPKSLSRDQSLASVPLRNQAIEVERTDEGEVRLVVPLRQTWWAKLLARVLYVPTKRTVVLDEIGSYVWELCDGQRNVRQIIESLSKRYKLHRKEAEVSAVEFLRQLARKGFIGIAVLKSDATRADERRGAGTLGDPQQ